MYGDKYGRLQPGPFSRYERSRLDEPPKRLLFVFRSGEQQMVVYPAMSEYQPNAQASASILVRTLRLRVGLVLVSTHLPLA